ncbi:MAG: hypothetical protein ACPGVT_02595 [Maricaulaceae bacterium]
MTTGRTILRQLDSAVSKARSRVKASANEAQEASEAIITLQSRQNGLYKDIARERLELLGAGQGGDLGYIDREAVKRLKQHTKVVANIAAKIAKSDEKQDALEAQRAAEAKTVEAAVKTYNKASAAAEAKLRKTADYQAQFTIVSDINATANRAHAKLKMAREDAAQNAAPFLADSFFTYLQGRDFGTDEPKGWFFTRWLDGILARRTGYKNQAKIYRHIAAVPLWLEGHLSGLIDTGLAEEDRLHKMEAAWLKAQGVGKVHKASILAQKVLDKTDEKIAAAEEKHDKMLAEQAQLVSGQAGPYKEAVRLMAKALSRHDVRDLDRLAAQTLTREDDKAVDDLARVLRDIEERSEDHDDAKRALNARRSVLRELQSVRKNFKSYRYDAYRSEFNSGYKITNGIEGVLNGSKSASSLWKLMKRKQYTVKPDTSDDFGGSGWSSGSRSSSSRSSSSRSSGSSWGSSSSSSSSRSSSSGFSTGGGFGGGSSSSSGFSTGGGF